MSPSWLPPIRTYPPHSHRNSSLRETAPLTPPLTPSSSIESALPTPDRFAFPSFSSPESFTTVPSRPSSPSGVPYRKLSNARADTHFLTRKRSFLNQQCEQEDPPPSRFILVGGVPKDKTALEFKRAFLSLGELKGIFVRFQAEHGQIILAFYDTRKAANAVRQLNEACFFDEQRLSANFLSIADLLQTVGDSSFVKETDGEIVVTNLGPHGALGQHDLHCALTSFGGLRAFHATDSSFETFAADFFDARDASTTVKALNNSVLRGARLRVAFRESGSNDGKHEGSCHSRDEFLVTRYPQTPLSQQFSSHEPPSKPETRRAVTKSESTPHSPPPTLSRRGSTGSAFGIPGESTSPRPSLRRSPAAHTRRNSEEDLKRKYQEYLDSGKKTPVVYAFDPPSPKVRMRSLNSSISSEEAPVLGPTQSGMYGLGITSAGGAPISPYSSEVSLHSPAVSSRVLRYPPGLREHLHYAPSPSVIRHQSSMPTLHHRRSHGQMLTRATPMSPMIVHETAREPPPERNRVDVDKIENGEDTRTTIMLKNVPNKLSDRELIEYINSVVPRSFDFLYLRVDFQNKCNVGYAFVNFIRVEDLLSFAKAKLGQKWNMFSSEKVLQMSYANFQGKEALVEKFKNSCIMEEQESWRPKIFYSHGPNVGLPEAFPPPNNLARAKRSGEQRLTGLHTSLKPFGTGGYLISNRPPHRQIHHSYHGTPLIITSEKAR